MIKLTIVVPFWNVDKYFKECLDSIVSQEMDELEILLVNDCSEDNSLEIAELYARKDPRIRIIHHEKNVGQGGARNTGIREAKGNYIWFIDSDDMISDKSCAINLWREAESVDADVVIFNFERLEEDKVIYRYSFNKNFPGVYDKPLSLIGFLYNNITLLHSVWNKIFRTKFLRDNHCYSLEKVIHQDSIQALWIMNAIRVQCIDKSFYRYRVRPFSSITSKKNGLSFHHLEKMSAQFEDYFFQHIPNQHTYRVLAFAKKVHFLLLETAPKRCFSDCSLWEKRAMVFKCVDNILNSKLLKEMNANEIIETYVAINDIKLRKFFTALVHKNRITLLLAVSSIYLQHTSKSFRLLRKLKNFFLPYGVVTRWLAR